MKERGMYIQTEQYDKLKNLNLKISDGLKVEEKDPKTGRNPLDNNQTPCTCFLTFESEEGYSRAQIYNKLIREGKLD